MFRLAGVSKSYDGQRALRPTDLEISGGRTTVLIGPSGCGKSTLIRLMLGLVRPDGGAVRFEGEEVTVASAPRLRRKMGYVIQDGGLFPHLTARANITLMARYLGQPTGAMDPRVAELSELTRLPVDALDRFPARLSGGQCQRVSLMRALMLDPDVLLLDEPLGALDPLIRFDLQADLRAIFQRLGKTVVMVTHDMGEAAYFADTIVLMKDGSIVQTGTIEDLWQRPSDPFVTRFIEARRSPRPAAVGGERR